MNIRLIPKDGENPYASHPGFDAQGCHLQYTVTPAQMGQARHKQGISQWSKGRCKTKRKTCHWQQCKKAYPNDGYSKPR